MHTESEAKAPFTQDGRVFRTSGVRTSLEQKSVNVDSPISKMASLPASQASRAELLQRADKKASPHCFRGKLAEFLVEVSRFQSTVVHTRTVWELGNCIDVFASDPPTSRQPPFVRICDAVMFVWSVVCPGSQIVYLKKQPLAWLGMLGFGALARGFMRTGVAKRRRTYTCQRARQIVGRSGVANPFCYD